MDMKTVSHYRILSQLGSGSGGIVYKAEDTRLRRPVALKFLPRELNGDPESSRRFIREARATSLIDHPNICNIHEVGETENGELFIAMAWYQGCTLKEILLTETVAPGRALHFAREVALGLARAHENDVIHRDIKPSNIMVTDRDEVKIVDFGLARLLGRAQMTRAGTVMGTAAYMSPEQARGEEAGPQSDIWALGVVLYEMLAGRRPFAGEHELALLYAVLNHSPKSLDNGACRPPELCCRIIQKCLAKDPGDRYSSAKLLAEDLRLAHRETASRTSLKSELLAGAGSSPRRSLKRWRMMTAALVVLMGLVLWPGSRNWINNHLGFTGTHLSAGVAVLPFNVAGEDSAAAAALGNGLTWLVSDRLSGLEGACSGFWVIPPGETNHLGLTGRLEAKTRLGVDRTLSASGHLKGDFLTLRTTWYDAHSGQQVTAIFEDNLANLHTWQCDLPQALAGQVDEKAGELARRDLNEVRTAVPAAFRDYLLGLGWLYATDRDSVSYALAAAAFARAVAQDSSLSDALAGLGYATWQLDRGKNPAGVQEAETFLLRAAAMDSSLVWPEVHLGEMYGRGANPGRGREYFAAALAIDPVNSQALLGMGDLEVRLGNMDAAAAAYRHAVDLRPHHAKALRWAGVFFYNLDDLDRAADYFQRVVDLLPDSYDGYNLLGATRFANEQYAESEDLFGTSVALEPNYLAFANLGVLHFYNGKLRDAAEMCTRSLAMNDGSYYSWRTLGESYYWTPGMRDSSRYAFQRATALAEDELAESRTDGYWGDPELRADLATFFVRLDQFNRARDLLDELADEKDLNSRVLFSMASSYENMGDRLMALNYLEQAMAANMPFKEIVNYPGLRNLRAGPAYQDLRRRYDK